MISSKIWACTSSRTPLRGRAPVFCGDDEEPPVSRAVSPSSKPPKVPSSLSPKPFNPAVVLLLRRNLGALKKPCGPRQDSYVRRRRCFRKVLCGNAARRRWWLSIRLSTLLRGTESSGMAKIRLPKTSLTPPVNRFWMTRWVINWPLVRIRPPNECGTCTVHEVPNDNGGLLISVSCHTSIVLLCRLSCCTWHCFFSSFKIQREDQFRIVV